MRIQKSSNVVSTTTSTPAATGVGGVTGRVRLVATTPSVIAFNRAAVATDTYLPTDRAETFVVYPGDVLNVMRAPNATGDGVVNLTEFG